MNIKIPEAILNILNESAEEEGMEFTSYVKKIIIDHYVDLINSKNNYSSSTRKSNSIWEPSIQKIGKYVRSIVDSLIETEKISESKLNLLTEEQYSQDNLHLNYIMFCHEEELEGSLKLGYYKSSYDLPGVKYHRCNDWYEQFNNNDRPFFRCLAKKNQCLNFSFFITHSFNHSYP